MNKKLKYGLVLLLVLGAGLFLSLYPFTKSQTTIHQETTQSNNTTSFVTITNPDGTKSIYAHTEGVGYINSTEYALDFYADNGQVIYVSTKNAELTENKSTATFDYTESNSGASEYSYPEFSYVVIRDNTGKIFLYPLANNRPTFSDNTISFMYNNKEISVNIDNAWVYSAYPEYHVDYDYTK